MGNWKNQNFFVALKNSVNGIKFVVKNERNLKIEFCFAIFAIILGIFLKISLVEYAIIILTIALVFIAEFINSAIENVVDLYTTDYNELAKKAKDISAGAVTVCSFFSIIIGIIIYLPKIYCNLLCQLI